MKEKAFFFKKKEKKIKQIFNIIILIILGVISKGRWKSCKKFPNYSWELLGPIIQSPGHVSRERGLVVEEPKMEIGISNSQWKSKGKENRSAARAS